MTSSYDIHRDIAWKCGHLTRQLIMRRRVTSDEYLVTSLKFKNSFFFRIVRENKFQSLDLPVLRFQVQSNQTPQKIEEEWKKVIFVKIGIQ